MSSNPKPPNWSTFKSESLEMIEIITRISQKGALAPKGGHQTL